MRRRRTLPGRGDGNSLRAGPANALDAAGEIRLDLEIPDPHDPPSGIGERRVHAPIARTVPSDLLVPERTRLAPIVVRVPVPERTVDEDRDAPPDPGDVG